MRLIGDQNGSQNYCGKNGFVRQHAARPSDHKAIYLATPFEDQSSFRSQTNKSVLISQNH